MHKVLDAGRAKLILGFALSGVLAVSFSGCASDSGEAAEPPTTSLSAWEVEFQEALADCMAEDGWIGKQLPSGVYDFTYSEEQYSAFNESNDRCVEEAGGNEPIERSPAEWRDLYDFYLTTAACLTEAGIPIADPPTYMVWEEQDHSWTPYESVRPDELGDRFPEILEQCPQSPSE